MRRAFKIALATILGIVILCVVLAIVVAVSVERHVVANTLNQQVQLTNQALLQVKGIPTWGPDSGREWEISYRGNSGWEEVGNWWGNDDGNLLACPVANLVVVARTGGPQVFVRTAAGKWRMFLMDVPGASYSGNDGGIAWNSTSLETADILAIRRQMSLNPEAQGAIDPLLVQLLPSRKELLTDYLTAEHRRFRLHLAITENGDKFRFLRVEEKPFDKGRSYFEQFVADASLDPTCSLVGFYRRY